MHSTLFLNVNTVIQFYYTQRVNGKSTIQTFNVFGI